MARGGGWHWVAKEQRGKEAKEWRRGGEERSKAADRIPFLPAVRPRAGRRGDAGGRSRAAVGPVKTAGTGAAGSGGAERGG